MSKIEYVIINEKYRKNHFPCGIVFIIYVYWDICHFASLLFQIFPKY